MNKMLTVTVNVMIWDKHASNAGIGALCLCLIGGSLYQQAPLKPTLGESGSGQRLTEISDRQPLTADSDEELAQGRRDSGGRC